MIALKKKHKHISKHKILGGVIFVTLWHKSVTKILNFVILYLQKKLIISSNHDFFEKFVFDDSLYNFQH